MHMLRTLILMTLVLSGILAGAGGHALAGPELPEIRAIRLAGAGDVTRVIIESDRELSPELFSATEAGALQLLIDLPLSRWRIDGVDRSGGRGEGGGLIAGFRYGQSDPGTSRLVLDLGGPAGAFRQLSLPPEAESPDWRVVIDLEPVSPKTFAAQVRKDTRRLARRDTPAEVAPAAEPARVAASAIPLPPALGGKRYVIVIDPGHGGRDPGTVSAGGLQEKDVNLRAALALRAVLELNPRFEVKLTRETDIFIPLEERVGLARQWGANLFISVHADSAEDSFAKGASVYTLSERGAARSKTAADKYDWTVPLPTQDVSPEVVDILEEFVERETKTKSGEFASLLIEELQRAGPILRNTHRSAGFVVLFAPDVPAVLVELGFLSNAEDARRLGSEKGREKAARALASAIDAYFGAQDLLLAGR